MNYIKMLNLQEIALDEIEEISKDYTPEQKDNFETEVYSNLSCIFDGAFIDNRLQEFYNNNSEWENEEEDEEEEEL